VPRYAATPPGLSIGCFCVQSELTDAWLVLADVDECLDYTPNGTFLSRAQVCRGCRFSHDVEFHYPLPSRTFAECWVYCLAFKSLECAAIEFEPDNKNQLVLEDTDKGTCYIQRRSSATISITKDPYRHVFVLYTGEAKEALSMLSLPGTMQVQQRLLRYHSSCGTNDFNIGKCVNTHGSYICVCPKGYITAAANASCVEAGGIGSYTSPSGRVNACPPNALSFRGAKTANDCFCGPGFEYQDLSSLLVVSGRSNSSTAINTSYSLSYSNSSSSSSMTLDARECVKCNAGLWSFVNRSCQKCFNNSWSLPGTTNSSNCLCNVGFYYDSVPITISPKTHNSTNGSKGCNVSNSSSCKTSISSGSSNTDNSSSLLVLGADTACKVRVRGTPDNPCVPCPPFSNTSTAGAKSISDCKCLPSYVKVIDPGDPSWFVCAPEDACREEDLSPCPKQGKSVCKSSFSEYQYECQCNPGQGFEDRALTGGFCLKMFYFNNRVVNMRMNVQEREISMLLVVPQVGFQSTQDLKDLVVKSRSKLFSQNQYVIAEYSGILDIQELSFYEVRDKPLLV
jgi:hypothetical protein